MKRDISATDYLRQLYPEEGSIKEFGVNVTFQVTEQCNLRCTYCYQFNKSSKVMSLETGKKIVDLLFKMYYDDDKSLLINGDTKQIILDFIGGEPTLKIELMDQICDYFWKKAIKLNHPWKNNFMISISSNGTLHFRPEVQKFLYKYKNHLSYSVSIDGTKDMHDACRIFPDGSGSFELAKAAQDDFNKNFYHTLGTKATIARNNLPYLNDIIRYYVKQGYTQVHANCVYEEEWDFEDAKLFYNQLKDIADYILSLDHEVEIALFEENFFTPKLEDDLQNWCWGVGTPILTIDGYKPIEEIKIGDFVYTRDGSYHKVINTKNHFANNCVKITSSGSLPLICTDDHKLFCIPFDYIGNKSKKHYKDYGKYAIKDLNNTKDLIQLINYPMGTNQVDLSVAYLLGRFIGDGWVTASGIPAICCGKSEERELKECFDNAGIKYNITETGTTKDFYAIKKYNIDNENYNLFFELANKCCKKAYNKKIPNECFSWDLNSLQSLIDGYVSADGYYRDTPRGISYSIGTSSNILAQQILLILKSLGYTPTCSKSNERNEEIIFGRKVNRHDFYNVFWYKNKNYISKYYRKIDNNIFSSRLHKEKVEDQQVYNITVEGEHSYIAGQYISSNCGGTGAMLAFDPDGNAFPCIRYMNSSLNYEQPALQIGDCENGIYYNEQYKNIKTMLESINRKTQSTEECFNCEIADGCSWCSGWNYQLFGTPNIRCTRICPMHKARSLANVYYWNKKYIKENINKYFHRYLKEESCLKIISKEELNKLDELENINKNKNNSIQSNNI